MHPLNRQQERTMGQMKKVDRRSYRILRAKKILAEMLKEEEDEDED
jgi:hypothetical protein